MPLDPLKPRLHPQPIPLLNLPHHTLHQIPILHFPARGRPPVIFPPVDVPGCDAVDGVFAVGEDVQGAVSWGEFEGAEQGGELGALVGLAGGGREGFGEVSASGREKVCQSTIFEGEETGLRGDWEMCGIGGLGNVWKW